MKNLLKLRWMSDEIIGEKKVCIKRKIHGSIFSVHIFENIIMLLSRGLMFEICWIFRGYKRI